MGKIGLLKTCANQSRLVFNRRVTKFKQACRFRRKRKHCSDMGRR
jgi:hypothetical protein